MKTEHNDRVFAVLFGLGGLIGILLGVLVLREVVSAMNAKSPAFWFISRAAGLVAYLLLWGSTVWGILISSKAVKEFVSGPLAVTLHNITAWVAIGFSMVHALALLGDRIVSFNLAGILVPFTASYQPFLTGLGTLSVYAGLLVTGSFYLSRRLGRRTWRTIHMLSYGMFVAVTVHSVFLGTDSRTLVMQMIYLIAGSSVLFLSLYRMLSATAGSPASDRVPAGRKGRSEPAG
jgi:sulfoxide reductase heme-binding subunit YedZ